MNLVSANAYERVLELTSPIGRGTAFTIDVDNAQYLVTARHLLPEGEQACEVEVANRFGRHQVVFVPLAMKQPQADIAVGRLSEPITVRHSLPPTMDGLFYSQDVFFLGFPYGLATVAGAANRLAFVKKGVLSASEEVNGVKIHYLDGHNNPGFSGGPVIGVNPSTDQAQVFAVVSGYRFDEQPVYVGTTVISEMATQVNAGIVISTDIKHAVEAITG